ncbi:MAG: cytochrome c maturation protein CcmE [Phycisphaerales bacterium]|nr:cytochrome c maturation protein CcmE [Phycisphaerales bacterium]
MTHTRVKLLGAGLVIAAATTILAVAGMREGWVYFLPVDQFMASGQHQMQRVRLHGTVGEERFEASRADLNAKFDLKGKTSSIRVEYTGVIPEMFQAGHDVVVEGQCDEAGVFHADTLLTKCASKYESADGQAPHANPYAAESAE